jgi:hypothetical protein
MNFLIPANSKKSMLILGVFDLFDLILFATGVSISILALFLLQPSSLLWAIVDITPGLVCGFLVMPIPNYRNTRVLLTEMYNFFTSRQKFIWKGWCIRDEYGEKK